MGLRLRHASRKNPQCISVDTPAVFSLVFLVSLPSRIPRYAATFETGSIMYALGYDPTVPLPRQLSTDGCPVTYL
jgi:hypothetical protein